MARLDLPVLAAARGIARHIERPTVVVDNHRAGGHRRPRARRQAATPPNAALTSPSAVLPNPSFKEGAGD